MSRFGVCDILPNNLISSARVCGIALWLYGNDAIWALIHSRRSHRADRLPSWRCVVVWLHRRTIRYRDFIFCKPCRIIYVKGWFPAKFVKYSKTLEAAKSVRITLQCSKPSSILYSEISSTLPLSSPSVAPADLAAKAEKRTACLKEIDETEKVICWRGIWADSNIFIADLHTSVEDDDYRIRQEHATSCGQSIRCRGWFSVVFACRSIYVSNSPSIYPMCIRTCF